ncbi:hypothetical protein Q73A0000_01330 [Kaistella flava (ex Peng et al. 2021)]|uniref:Uncharacterized protein n=1 Tax=Kaistella flava (ex Peng et al. 2021) TaxID=2038776 RepID=A0A7M2Y5Y9_9FLAO|nr:hypothetical protein [Kaistella flava (ex Peng et al. 2021)]QOW09084.1 hypothetical protein Q73A0000_01330 [Kaistella flava (ex Peng et al. 2021)]
MAKDKRRLSSKKSPIKSQKTKPLKGFASVNQIFKDKGYRELGKEEYEDFEALAKDSTEYELKELYKNKSLPLFLRLIVGTHIEKLRKEKLVNITE